MGFALFSINLFFVVYVIFYEAGFRWLTR